MGILSNVKTDKAIKPQSDYMGGYGTLETGLYDFTIEMMYVDESVGGAAAVHFDFVSQQNERFSTIQYVTGGRAKKQRNYYMDKDNKKQYLPGFNLVNNLCQLALGKDLSEIDEVIKTLELYDFKTRSKVAQKKEVLEEMNGQSITIGIIKQIVNKSVKNDDGSYSKINDTKEENVIGKIFQADTGLTKSELDDEVTEPDTKAKWDKTNTGKTKDKSVVVKSGGAKKTVATKVEEDVPDLFDE